MFAWWGRIVYRYRFIVIGVTVALCLGGGVFGLSLGKHVTQSGFYDDSSQSVKASILGDQVYGRDRTGHIVAIFKAPDGKTVNDPAWSKKITDELNRFVHDHPDQVMGWAGYLRAPDTTSAVVKGMATEDKKYTFVSIPLKGDDDDTILTNYKDIAPSLQKLDGGTVQLAGLEPVAEALTGTIATDQRRMEVLALPLVAVVLFLVFGGAVAACLPVMVGGLSIAGALGILRLVAVFGPVHFFAQPVVSLIGLGIAVDYGLFVVSRFREEIAEGYDTEAAVRRTVMTAGRTVAFSAVLIIASGISLLMLPQGFVKSLTYALIAAVGLAALLSITLLPAVLGVLGRHVDALGVRTAFRVPFLRNWKVSRAYLNWLADRLQKTKTREEVEAGFWGKLVNWVMRRPLVFAIPIVLGMILLVIPLFNLSLGGMSEKYLPPNNSVRQSQEHFDQLFPGYRTNPLTLVIQSTNHQPVTDQQVADIRSKAMSISGFIEPDNDPANMWQERSVAPGASKDPSVRVLQNGLINPGDAAKKLQELRAITPPKGLEVFVGGTPALEQDSIHSLFANMPAMLVILLTATTLLMFLAFGSVVLPIKAAVMSALTLGSTMGILTWIFVDGHGSGLLNFTATPLTAPVIALVVAVGYGLATDYEVFLVSRMVEARESGMSTQEAIRIGTATTGRLITAAALVLAVVAGSFVFSDLVMMKYLAFGLMAALLLDATVVRMFLVPSVMKLLGDDCWWAPRWMRRVQTRIGLGEIQLPDERKRPVTDGRVARPPVTAGLVAAGQRPPHDPTHPSTPESSQRGSARPEIGPAQSGPSSAGTKQIPVKASQPNEPPTTRLSTPGKPGTPGRGSSAPAPPAPSSARPPAPTPPPAPSAGQTRAMPIPGSRSGQTDSADATAKLPVQRPEDSDSDAATEQLDARSAQGDNGADGTRRRRGAGGLSAQDLLRREGRL
ncbi:MAG: MMPL family transporter [Mycobacterium pseudokansasii]|uniref:Trehalose monomycolate exporter MmpL3 n=1 Tax=Mycobacterium pseudokansasii TaxID=2341080 RepID=A0A498QLL7_9MYCO|nr:MMPL family transporter [Mycobacterium pseudokansasii]MBY0387850.1 MMPL family transporter [Mycobacterium pseudokansasii]VAZ88070.1 Trehalose monomycolate exporter MmpL3 [Mycobacterium pseudokansasii]VAZ88483.1 Trehalose monomycolate exporter MmpL3 [Mycobacterium pseudokansasii]VBA46317.1 Trehalose monomycolate exporter MmpL3 [Mycobacterium pseudokansasii]